MAEIGRLGEAMILFGREQRRRGANAQASLVVAFVGILLSAWPGAAQIASTPHAPATVDPALDPAQGQVEQAARDREAGIAAFERGDYAQATDYFRRVRQYDPSNDEAMFLLGRAYLAAGSAAAAIDQLTSAIALNDKVDKYFYARAKAELRLGQYAASVADFDRDLELRQSKPTPIFFLSRGDALLGNGQTELAIKDYRAVLAMAGDLREAYLHLGVALARTGDRGHALEALDAAEAAGKVANALDFDTYFYRGAVEALGGDKAAALRDFNAAAGFNDSRKPQAKCLARAIDTSHHHLFGGSGGCGGIDAAKALQSQPAL